MPGTPKPYYKYRQWRRNNSELGYGPTLRRGEHNWWGVEAKKGPDHPPLVITFASEKAKHPGEVHYTRLW